MIWKKYVRKGIKEKIGGNQGEGNIEGQRCVQMGTTG